ncbi:MAG: hypothetical protein LBG48_04780, partial [Rickettsiales bacterium]|nr:hypothetical protein [Rickettsiales bacterium]
ITGGAALIKSAQLRVLITEFQNYRVAFNTYYGLYDKVPGGRDNCDGLNTVCNSHSAWEELKDEGIIEKTHSDGFLPSKYKNAYWRIENGGGGYFEVSDFQNTNNLLLSGGDGTAIIGLLGVKETKSLLDKLDDGSPNTGLVRALEFDGADTNSSEEATPESLSEADSAKRYALVSKLDF